MRRGAQEAADRLGVTCMVQAAEREIDVEKQMQIVENLIQTGIQALCITPSGSREIVPALVKANARQASRSSSSTRASTPRRRPTRACKTRDVRRLRQLRGRQARRRIPGEGHRRQGAGRRSSKGIPGHETGDSRMRGFRDAVKDSPGIDDRRVAARELGARSGLQRVPEHAAGAPGHRHACSPAAT